MELKARDEPGDKGWIKQRMESCTLPKELFTNWLRVTICVCIHVCVCVCIFVCMYPCRCEKLSNFLSGPIRWRELGPQVWKPPSGNRSLISGSINCVLAYVNMCVRAHVCTLFYKRRIKFGSQWFVLTCVGISARLTLVSELMLIQLRQPQRGSIENHPST